ncbi:hypothetical protein BYT27DRAFT_6697968 [Phlegmacium glaucopus]|nr:hypothetical protein BYT27DRAFT_6697968 [Phlegmacium glaucopus]
MPNMRHRIQQSNKNIICGIMIGSSGLMQHDDERIQNIIDEDTKKRQFRNIRNLAVLRHSQLASGEGRLAYIGDAHNVLYETITSQIQSDYRSSVRYQAIIQSSCIGKSRMVDQLSKKHLVIPINLRRDGPGFPPGDAQVVDFLLRLPFNQIDAYKRSQAFLISLFKAAHVVLGGIAMTMKDVSPETSRELFSQEFRNYTRAGQTFEKHGSNRVLFYNRVISQAKSVC